LPSKAILPCAGILKDIQRALGVQNASEKGPAPMANTKTPRFLVVDFSQASTAARSCWQVLVPAAVLPVALVFLCFPVYPWG
jgi:hypothetical protein